MKTVAIVNKMIGEYDSHGETLDDSLFLYQDRSRAFATLDDAKKYIENDIAENYTECDRYVDCEVVRRDSDGAWKVTVYYDSGRVEYQAAEVEIPQD